MEKNTWNRRTFRAQSLSSPERMETLKPGDRLLVLGTPEQVNEMAFWLST